MYYNFQHFFYYFHQKKIKKKKLLNFFIFFSILVLFLESLTKNTWEKKIEKKRYEINNLILHLS